MNRSPVTLLALLLLVLTLPCLALAEAEDYGVATPAMAMSLEETAALGLLPAPQANTSAFAPFVPDTLDKTVVGEDDRTSITAPGTYPYSAIAYIRVKARCGCDWTGSGFMVSKDCMMTAAHCLVCREHGETAGGLTLYFGYRSDKNYLVKYNGATTYWYGTNVYTEDGRYNTDWDYAYVHLEKNVGDTTGWFGLTARSNAELQALSLEVAGFRYGTLKTSRGNLTCIGELSVKHNADTEPGYSGCPIFTNDYYVVAINVAENTGVGFNVGRRITGDLIGEMREQNMFD